MDVPPTNEDDDPSSPAKATAAAVPTGPSEEPRKEQLHPEDDDILSSIRTVRRMVEREFMEADRRRRGGGVGGKNRSTSTGSTKDGTTEERREGDSADAEDGDDDDHDDDDDEGRFSSSESWKSRCFRLKQELFEERKRAEALSERHEDELARSAASLEGALREAAADRETRTALVETLEAQRRHSDGLARRLSESASNSERFRVLWKDLVRSAEDEKESMDREREAAAELLEAIRTRLVASLEERHRERRDAAERSEALSKRVEELERRSRPTPSGRDEEEVPPPPSSSARSSPCWNQSKTRSVLQRKLKKLEDGLAKNAEAMRSLERQIASTSSETTSTIANAAGGRATGAAAAAPAAEKDRWNEEKEGLRIDSVNVLGEVITLQLQRLMELHVRATTVPATETAAAAAITTTKPEVKDPAAAATATTAATTDEKPAAGSDPRDHDEDDDDDGEWASVLRNLSRNRGRMLELRRRPRREPDPRGSGRAPRERDDDDRFDDGPSSKRPKNDRP